MADREGDELVFAIMRGEAASSRRPSDGDEDDYRREDRRPVEEDDVVDDDVISSFLNPSGEGDPDQLLLEDGQIPEDDDDADWIGDDDPSPATTGEVYIHIPVVTRSIIELICIYIYINHRSLFLLLALRIEIEYLEEEVWATGAVQKVASQSKVQNRGNRP